MKILFASHSSGVAGAERSLVELARAAGAMGHSGWVILPRRGPLEDLLTVDGPFAVRFCASANWVGNRSSGVVGLFRLVQCLLLVPAHLLLLFRLRPDVVIVNSSVSPCFVIAGYLMRIPVSVVVRESIFQNARLKSLLSPGLRRRLLIRWTKKSIVAVSEFVGVDWPGAECVWPPIEAKYLRRYGSGRTSHVADACRPTRIAMVGTIDPSKGQADLLKAAQMASIGGMSLDVWIAGGGTDDDIAALRSTIALVEVPVKFTSEWIDSLDVYEWCDFSVVCSTSEAFGKVTVESLLCRKPVVGYRCGGTVEIARLGGVALIDPNVHALAAQIALMDRDEPALHALRSDLESGDLASDLEKNAERAVLACLRRAEGR